MVNVNATKVFNATALAQTGTIYSDWQRIDDVDNFALFLYPNSVAGSVEMTLYCDISPIGDETVLTRTSTNTTTYVSVTVATGVNTEAMSKYTSKSLTNLDWDYPAMHVRFRLTGTGSNNADTLVTAWLVTRSRICEC